MIPIGITGARFQLIHAQNPIIRDPAWLIRDPAWLIHDPAWLTGDPNRDHGRSAFGSPMHRQRTNFSRQVAARVGPHFAAAGMQPRVRRVQPAQIAGQESVIAPKPWLLLGATAILDSLPQLGHLESRRCSAQREFPISQPLRCPHAFAS